jgi:hypothetical protein
LKQLRGIVRMFDPGAFKTPKIKDKILEYLDAHEGTYYSAKTIAEGISLEMWSADSPTQNNKVAVANALKRLAKDGKLSVETDNDGKTKIYCYSEEETL